METELLEKPAAGGTDDRYEAGYVRGFIECQALSCCERVKTGQSLAGEIGIPERMLDVALKVVEQEGCKARVEKSEYERAGLLIYADDFVLRIADTLRSAPTDHFGVWATGKMFGYADREILDYIKQIK